MGKRNHQFLFPVFFLSMLVSLSYGKIVKVTEFGAVGDARTDNTLYFQNALNSVKDGGGIVTVPAGQFLIKGTLIIPPGVTLEGTSRNAPPRDLVGSILLTVFGKGKPEEDPFILLKANSTLCGVVIFHPEQRSRGKPYSYPWTIRGHGDNCSIQNCLLLNPYKAVDFGTYPCGRHNINNLYARPLYRGLYIDKCYDVGRATNIHFWPFWESEAKDLRDFQEKNAIAFVIGRTDWQYMLNCFCLWYAIGYRFIKSPEQGTGNSNVNLTNCGSDLGPVAIKVDEVQNHAGISFVNSQLMGAVILENSNHGPVKFTNCGFWGIETTESLVYNRSAGRTSFSNCQFYWWDRAKDIHPAILSQNGDLTVIGCEFGELNLVDIFLSKNIRSAIIMGNTLRTKRGIINRAGRKARIKNNIFSYRGYQIIRVLNQRKLRQKIKDWNQSNQ
jgi:hypothetical protein